MERQTRRWLLSRLALVAGGTLLPVIAGDKLPQPQKKALPAGRQADVPSSAPPAPKVANEIMFREASTPATEKPIYVSNTQKEIQTVLKILLDSPSGLVRKASRDLRSLVQVDSRPLEFPDWVDENSFPVVITRDFSADPATRLFLEPKRRSGLIRDFIDTASDREYRELEEVSFRFLFDFNSLEKFGRFGGGLLLAKEYLAAMLGFKIATEFYDLVYDSQNPRFTERDGRPIVDRERQIRVGATYFVSMWKDRETGAARLVDDMTTLFLAASLPKDMSNSGAFDSFPARDKIELVRFLIRSRGNFPVRRSTESLVNSWVESNNFGSCLDNVKL